MSFGIRIGAQDDTQGALRTALSSFSSFARTLTKPITIPLQVARGGLALLRDINLGLRPLITGLDNLIERGTALEAVQKSFRALTGRTPEQAEKLARHLVAAAQGGMRLSQAMQVANRAIAMGIDPVRDLPTIFEFAAKKAMTTGMDFFGAVDRIVAGLGRMTSRTLDDFGLLRDSVEAVQQKYEALRGAGSWEALSVSARRAEFIRHVLGEMREQLGKMGVTGKETISVWGEIKNQIGDAVDNLFAAVGRSQALQDAIRGIRDMLSGMAKHIERGGSFWDMLFGKPEKIAKGLSGGLFGLLKAGMIDLGEMAGRAIAGGLLKGLSKLPVLGEWLWEKLNQVFDALREKLAPIFEPIKKAIDDLTSWFKEKIDPVIEWLENKIKPIVDWLRDKFGINAGGVGPSQLGRGSGYVMPSFGAQWWAATLTGKVKAVGLIATDFLDRVFGALSDAASYGGRRARESAWAAERRRMKISERWEEWGREYGQVRPAAPKYTPVGQATLTDVPQPFIFYAPPKMPAETIWDKFSRWGNDLLEGVSGFGRVRRWFGEFQKDFPPFGEAEITPDILLPTSKYALSLAGRRRRQLEIARLEREVGVAERGGMFVRQEAIRQAGAEMERLRREGYAVGPRERREILARIQKELTEQLVAPQRERVAKLHEELRGGAARQAEINVQRREERLKREADDEMRNLLRKVQQYLPALLAAIPRVLAELVSADRRLAAAGAR